MLQAIKKNEWKKQKYWNKLQKHEGDKFVFS